MKTYRPFVLPGSLVACLFAVSSLSAQVAPATSADPKEEEKSDTIVLSPFVVTDEQDQGYIATSTLAGSRMNTLLKDTPASISVLTAEFLADIGAQNLEEAIEWSTNANIDGQQGIALSSSTSNDNATFYSFGDVQVRGLPATKTRNYFGWRLPSDTYNIDRIEEARGPNSILFGLGSAGGVLNTQTKRAVIGREIRRGSVTFGSYESYRGTFDLNQPIGDKLALRINGVYTRNGSYREYVEGNNQMIHLAGTWQATSKTRVRAEYETGVVDQIVPSNDPVTDQYTTWTTTGGSQLITAPIPSNQNGARGVARYGGGVTVTYISNSNTLLNVANSYRSVGSDNLVPYIDPSMGDYSVNTGGWGAVRRGDFETYSAFIEQELWKNTYLELGYNHQSNFTRSYMPAGNSRRLYADVNATLPNGQPNPNAGRFFLEGPTWTWNTPRASDTLRASFATELDFGKWGNYRFGAMAEKEDREVADWYGVEAWEGQPYHVNPENAANLVTRRHYVTPGDWSSYYRSSPKSHGLISGLVDPITGRTLSSTMVPRVAGVETPEEQETKLVSLQARYFDGRLIFGGGYRWDDVEITNHASIRNPQTLFWEIDHSTATVSPYEGKTRTYGVMAHVTNNISLFYNNSNNFGIPGNARILPDSVRAGNPTATGEDIGVLFNFFDNKVSARVSYYKTDLSNGSGFGYGGTLTNPSSVSRIILDALVDQGVITQAQSEPHRTNSNGSTFNRLVEGYEFNVTANPTRNWRVQANFSITDGFTSNIAPEVKDWVAVEIPYLSSFDQNIITGNAAMTIGQVLAEFDEYHQSQLNSEGLLLPGNRKYKANLYTSYTFDEGVLKGLTVGGGYNWKSKLPAGLVGREVRWSNDVWNTNAMLRYRFNNVPFFKRLDVQLNITNLTDDDEMEIIRYAGNNPDFPTYNILRRVRVKEPRSFRLSANFDF